MVWPPTRQMQIIPVASTMKDGSLDKMSHWEFDENTGAAFIVMPDHVLRLVSPHDLMKFGKADIYRLSRSQIKAANPVLEVSAKGYTAMVAKMIAKGWFAGVFHGKNVEIWIVD